jgi:hypothetical protein
VVVVHAQGDAERDVEAWLRRKFEGRIREVEVVLKEDLDLVRLLCVDTGSVWGGGGNSSSSSSRSSSSSSRQACWQAWHMLALQQQMRHMVTQQEQAWLTVTPPGQAG